MKTALACCLALVSLASARAQVFRPEAVNGAVLGGIAGAVIGNNSGDLRHNAWKGAAIGAGAGLLLGEAIGNANASRASYGNTSYAASGGYVYSGAPAVRVGVGVNYGHGYYDRRHGYFGNNYGYGRGYYDRGYYGRGYYGSVYVPTYSYYDGYGAGYPYYGDYGYYGTGSATANGLLLGALAGGIIGHNSGSHNGWRGAAIGAGAGLVLGAIVDANRRPVAVQQAPVVQGQVQAAPAPAAQPTTIINNYYNAPAPTPMSGANALFGR